MKKIFISAGELSGDRHAANLVTAIKKKDPSVHFFGMGGPHMRRAGVQIVADVTQQSTVGFFEALVVLPKIISAYIKVRKVIKKEQPDLAVVVDYQGYHVALLKWLKKRQIPAVYYIGPQEWHWGTEVGGKNVIALTKKVLSIFKDEHQFYERLDGNSVFVGHPLVDATTPDCDEKTFRNDAQAKGDILAVFPGSRPQEFKRVAPKICLAAKQVKAQLGAQLSVVVSLADERYRDQLDHVLKQTGLEDCTVYTGNSHNLIAYAKASIVTSGTVSVEHALLQTPAVVCYAFHPFTYFMAKKIMMKRLGRLPYMSMANELLGEEVMPEFLQDKAIPEVMAKATIDILTNRSEQQRIQEGYGKVRRLFGEPGAVDRAANETLALLG